MKTKSTLGIMMLTTILLSVTREEGICQTSAVQWSSFSSGFGVGSSSVTTVKSSAGQVFARTSQQANSRVESGFLALPSMRGPTAGVGEHPDLPLTFSLSQNYPNPFNPSTLIKFTLPQKSHVTLTMYNTLGQQVAALINQEQEAGYYEVRFESPGLSSGVYFYRLQAGTFVDVKKLVLLR